jgi:hypothetical protein
MKKSLLVLLIAVLTLAFAVPSFAASGLSLETHMKFSPRVGEKVFMETFTGWADDSTGGWFFFIDLSSASEYSMGYGFNYFEVARDFSFGKIFGSEGLNPLSLHLEYNGSTHDSLCSYLTGLKYELSGYPYILTISLSAKMHRDNGGAPEPDPTWQATFVWSLTFSDGLMNFNGFVDVWNNTGLDKIAFLTQPQFLFNLGKLGLGKTAESFWLGTEVEIRKNAFGWDSTKVNVTPSVFLRYDF